MKIKGIIILPVTKKTEIFEAGVLHPLLFFFSCPWSHQYVSSAETLPT